MSVVAASEVTGRARANPRRGRVLSLIWIGGLALLWSILIRALASQWSLYPNYSYGWSIPGLALFLLWKRCKTGLESSLQGNAATRQGHWLSARTIVFFTGLAIALLLLALLPTRLVLEANPGWRLAHWILALEVVGITFGAALLAGGSAAVRSIAFPISFFLVAVPWPSGLEEMIIQALTRLNTSAVVEVLGWAGIPALQRGNVIEISTGLIGIDDACSGLRSLQATLMIGLFFGELYWLAPGRRVLLLVAGFLLALACNGLRTLVLVWVCDRQGMAALSRWHDPAGISILLFCFSGLWLAAVWFRKRDSDQPIVASAPPALARGGRTSAAANDDWQPGSAGARRPVRLAFTPVWLGLAFLSWGALVEIGTEIWFRAGERTARPEVQWAVRWPLPKQHCKELNVPDRVREILQFSRGHAAAWREADGSAWQMFFFEWDPGKTEDQLAQGHGPEICLPAAGRALKQDRGVAAFEVGGLQLPFHRYIFDDQGRTLHVFRCLWEDRPRQASAAKQDWSRRSRLMAAWEGRRNLGQRVLEMVVWGIADPSTAEAAFRRELEALVIVP